MIHESKPYTLEQRQEWAAVYKHHGRPFVSEPLTQEGVVSVISHKMYYHLHRIVNGVHYLGFSHGGPSLSVFRINPDRILNWATREPCILKTVINNCSQREEESCLDEPYLPTVIAQFLAYTATDLAERPDGY